MPDGTIVHLRPRLTQTLTAASNSCDSSTLAPATPNKTIMLPPPPGLRAKRDGEHVAVTVAPGDLPSACRPNAVTIALTTDDPEVPAATRDTFPLHKQDPQTIEVLIPSYLKGQLIVAVTANLVLPTGFRGATARVLVSP